MSNQFFTEMKGFEQQQKIIKQFFNKNVLKQTNNWLSGCFFSLFELKRVTSFLINNVIR